MTLFYIHSKWAILNLSIPLRIKTTGNWYRIYGEDYLKTFTDENQKDDSANKFIRNEKISVAH